MTELTLDGRDTRFRVLRITNEGFMQPCFGAKCTVCGAWLTKWDFSEEDAAACAVHALDVPGQSRHRCAA